MNNEKTILILGAGRGQVGLYKAAKDLGIRTIAGTLPTDNRQCLDLADDVCLMNIADPDDVESKTKNLKFDGVASCCIDMSLPSLGRLCDKYSLPGYGEKAASMCNDKLSMKKCLTDNNVNTAMFTEVSDVDILESAVEHIGGYPVIIKASDLAGSMGINKAFNKDEAVKGFSESMSMTKKNFVIVEKLLQGREFGAQAFVSNGEVLFVMPHGDILFHGATDVPIGHYVPMDADENLIDKIKIEAIKAIKALSLNNCAVNIDFIEQDGTVYVIELSGRIGANGLPEVVSAHYGIDYYKMVVLAALGESVEEVWDHKYTEKPSMSRMIISDEKEGVLEDIYYDDNNVYEHLYQLNIFVKKGSIIHKFSNSNHCLGQVVTTGNSLDECNKTTEKILSNIIIAIK